MEDLSLHVLDIAENSLRAGAKNINIKIIEEKIKNVLILQIEDDGIGMKNQILTHASNPFYTTKEGKKFGLGLALLSQACEEVGGNLKVKKRTVKGTRIIATFYSNHIDMKPLGNIADTMRVLKFSHPQVNFSFEHVIKNGGNS